MDVVLDAKQIEETLARIAQAVAADLCRTAEPAIIGIRSRGEILARRLTELLQTRLDREIEYGELDITLYRDDLNDPQGDEQPTVRSTEIDFDVTGKRVLLVDDVLHTGRTTRAAMDALIALGRPKTIRLAVLLDRGGRELPIQADYVGCTVEVPPGKAVRVQLAETDDVERVIIE